MNKCFDMMIWIVLFICIISVGLWAQEDVAPHDSQSMGLQTRKWSLESLMAPMPVTPLPQAYPGATVPPSGVDVLFKQPIRVPGKLKHMSLETKGHVESDETVFTIEPVLGFGSSTVIRLEASGFSRKDQMFSWVLPSRISQNQSSVIDHTDLWVLGFRFKPRLPAYVNLVSMKLVMDMFGCPPDADTPTPNHLKALKGSQNPELGAELIPLSPQAVLPFLPSPQGGDWKSLKTLFGTSPRCPDYPGFPLFREQLLLALWKADPGLTLELLQNLGSDLWNWIEPEQLLALIGWEWLPWFDNLSFYLGRTPEDKLLIQTQDKDLYTVRDFHNALETARQEWNKPVKSLEAALYPSKKPVPLVQAFFPARKRGWWVLPLPESMDTSISQSIETLSISTRSTGFPFIVSAVFLGPEGQLREFVFGPSWFKGDFQMNYKMPRYYYEETKNLRFLELRIYNPHVEEQVPQGDVSVLFGELKINRK